MKCRNSLLTPHLLFSECSYYKVCALFDLIRIAYWVIHMIKWKDLTWEKYVIGRYFFINILSLVFLANRRLVCIARLLKRQYNRLFSLEDKNGQIFKQCQYQKTLNFSSGRRSSSVKISLLQQLWIIIIGYTRVFIIY